MLDRLVPGARALAALLPIDDRRGKYLPLPGAAPRIFYKTSSAFFPPCPMLASRTFILLFSLTILYDAF